MLDKICLVVYKIFRFLLPLLGWILFLVLLSIAFFVFPITLMMDFLPITLGSAVIYDLIFVGCCFIIFLLYRAIERGEEIFNRKGDKND